mmetsp:Transcript_128829/g.240913  ORF Transcript_128829/g.240913 Transcript_128829/m.240913 type:complete len:95 (+) Transcript_128829:1285-1569(+)
MASGVGVARSVDLIVLTGWLSRLVQHAAPATTDDSRRVAVSAVAVATAWQRVHACSATAARIRVCARPVWSAVRALMAGSVAIALNATAAHMDV